MPYYVSVSPNHCLSDFAGLVLSAYQQTDKKPLYIYQRTSEYFSLFERKDERIPRLKSSKIIEAFDRYAAKAAVCDDKPKKALALFQDRIKAKYYSGMFGKIRLILNRLFGLCRFENREIAKKIDKLAVILEEIPKTKGSKEIPKIERKSDLSKLVRNVFTVDLKNTVAHGAMPIYLDRKWRIKWMSPDDYLRQVDLWFQRHPDEKNLSWILNEMASLANGYKKGVKFAPLMMDPNCKSRICEGYSILDHEGRHRAFAARLLGLPEIPVAISIS
jgi:hypothetical protein